MDAAVDVRQQRPGRGVQEDDRQPEEGRDHEDAADDQRVDAQSGGDARRDTAQPALGPGDAETGDPEEESLGSARDAGARCAGGRSGVVGGGRWRSRNRHASILAAAAYCLPWGNPERPLILGREDPERARG